MDDRELLRSIARHLGVTSGASVTLGKLYVTFKATQPRGRRWQHERNLLKPFIVHFWRAPSSSLTVGDWIRHRAHRRKEKTRLGRAPCDLTLNQELAAAKRLFKWAVRSKLIPVSPFLDCRPVKTRSRRESWFTAPQIEQLLSASWSLRWDHQQRTFRALVAVMADTGLRISEALSLRWDRLTLRGTTSVIGKGAKTRVVAFTARAMQAMTSLGQHPNNSHVFTNTRSWKVYNASTVRRWFRQAIAAAKLEGVKADGDLALVPHLLRHSFASIADERGAPAEWIRAAMGHTNLSTTAIYLHRNEHDAAIRMAAVMGERKPPRRSAGRNSLDTKKEFASATAKIVSV